MNHAQSLPLVGGMNKQVALGTCRVISGEWDADKKAIFKVKTGQPYVDAGLAKEIERRLNNQPAVPYADLVSALKECVEALYAELGLDERYKIEAIQEDALERAEALLKKLEAGA